MKLIILLGMMSICSGAPQFLISLPQSYSQGSLAHPAVLETAAREARYPDQQRNNFYKNPFISAGLARESLPTNKEMIVNHRHADDIPRERIYNMLRNAGLVRK